MNYYAHTLPNESPEKWQLLEEHLKNTAEMAKIYFRFSITDFRLLNPKSKIQN